MMIRRAIALIVLTASLFVGAASTADAGELCLKINPFELANPINICAPTN